MISKIVLLFSNVSFYVLSSLIRGAMKTGDSKHTAISVRNLLLAWKFKFGKSRAKLIYFSFSFFSIKAIVLFM